LGMAKMLRCVKGVLQYYSLLSQTNVAFTINRDMGCPDFRFVHLIKLRAVLWALSADNEMTLRSKASREAFENVLAQ